MAISVHVRMATGRIEVRPVVAWLFVACGLGMLVGAWIDTRHVDAEALIALCSSAGAVQRWRSMWTWMPATHVLMLLGGVAAAVAMERQARRDWLQRLRVHGGCLLAMTVGMAIGSRFALPLANAFGSGFAGLLAAMAAGMGMAMLLTAPLLECRIARRGSPRST